MLDPTAICYKIRWSYIRNNLQSVAFFNIFLLINAILFIDRLISYSPNGWWVMLARANGQCLNFTCSFVIICVLKRSITFLRSLGCSSYLPLDHHIYFHKLIGWFICFYSVFHSAMHVVNFKILSDKTKISWFDYLFTTKPRIGWISGAASVTGWILLLILVIMMVPAQPFMRRSGKFEVFYYTHLLHVFFYFCLFLHAPYFWIWFILPFSIFVVEAIIRIISSLNKDRGFTYIEQGVILPSKVIQLIIRRPTNFDFHPGDYTYVQIPEITKYEWHPLTISSAPEQSEIIWLHIRVVGEWTSRLYNYFEVQERKNSTEKRIRNYSDSVKRKRQTPLRNRKILSPESPTCFHQQARILVLPIPDENQEKELSAKKNEKCADWNDVDNSGFEPTTYGSPPNGFATPTKFRSPFFKEVAVSALALHTPLKVRLDGPYGSPSSHIFRTQHAVLIATGIGVTPFASILQSIWHRYVEAKRTCPSCKHSWSDPIPPNVMKLRKVDFMWINREVKSFEWFVSLLNDLETQQNELGESERFLDIHMYLTSQSVQVNLMNEMSGFESIQISPTKEKQIDFNMLMSMMPKMNFGRPNWSRFFKEMALQKKGKITVFFCGRPDLAKQLRTICNGFGFEFRKEVF